MDTLFDAPVIEVVLHRNGALVRRRGVSDARALSLGGLPLLYQSDSLRVRPERGRVGGLRELCGLEATTQPPDPQIARRADLQLQAAQLDDRDRTLNLEIQALEAVAPTPPPPGPRARLPDAAGWTALSASVRERLAALDAERAALQVQRRDLARERVESDRRSRVEPTPPRFHRGVRFDLLDAGDGPVRVEVEYFVEAARWLPAWRLELTGTSGRLSLEAFVAQATGEDWRGARLHFSTADLRRETTLPELLSWRIGPAQAAPRPAFRPLPPGLDALFSGYDTALRHVPIPPAPGAAAMAALNAATAAARAELEVDTGYDQDLGASPEMDEMSEMDDDTDYPSMMESAAPPPPPSFQAPTGAPMPGAPMRQAMPERSRSNMPQAKAMARGGFGSMGAEGGGGMLGGAGPMVVAPPAPPPQLRHPWLRLAGPEETGRGTLRPLDPFTQLWALVEGHPTAAPDQLRRALDGLQNAAAALFRGPPPAGTRPLPADHFPSLYTCAQPADVPGDGAYHRIRVADETAEARIELRAVPRESPDVWRYCRLAVAADVPRPSGPLAVYRDGEFVTTTTLPSVSTSGQPTVGAEESLSLNLGPEADVRISHRAVNVQSEDKGLMDKTTRVDHHIAVKVRSALPRALPLFLYDRLPVASDDRTPRDIEVTLLESQPAPTRTDRDPDGQHLAGGLFWRVELAPGETTVLEYTYRVTLPAKFELDGGNRREN